MVKIKAKEKDVNDILQTFR